MTGMLLTRATLAPQNRSLAALLAEQGAGDGGHRLIWTLFPDTDGKTDRDFLFRTVDDRTFLILSQRAPQDAHGIWCLEPPKPFLPEPRVGERYTFLLRANPAVKPFHGAGPGADRGDAVMHAKKAARAADLSWDREAEADAALCWLLKREERLGVQFLRQATSATGYRQVSIGRRGARSIRFSTVDYEGHFEVTDPDRLMSALTRGVGKAKAFGCGLMLIRRA